MNDDMLESLLTNADRSTVVPEIRGEDLAMNVRRRHAEWQRRRDRRNRGAILVGGYLAGVLSMWLWVEAAHVDSDVAIGRHTNSGGASKSPPRTNVKTDAPPAHRQNPLKPAVSVVDVDLETPYERYRRLGDAALTQDHSVDLAVEFYRRALDAASKKERSVAFQSDTWVLIKLKQSRSDTPL